MQTIALVSLLALPAHVGQDQFGRFPFVEADAVVGGGTSWGVVLPDENNGGWGRVCEEAFGPAVFFALRQPGRILLGGLDGLSSTTDAGCSYQQVDNVLAGTYASALWLDRNDDRHLIVGTSTVSADNGLWESRDSGDTFTALLPPRPGGFFRVAVSDDGVRIAASGIDAAARARLLFSADAGATFVDVTAAVADYPLVHALVFDGDLLVLGGINVSSEGIVDHVAFDGVAASLTPLGTVARETTAAVVFRDRLFVLSRNGARGEVYVKNDSPLGFGLVQGGPSDCLVVHDDALYGCGKQVGLNTALFLRSDDGDAWTEVVAFREVHYRACPEDTPGYAACGNYIETACNDDVDNEVDGAVDCDDDDCKVHPACTGGAGEGEGEGETDDGDGGRFAGDDRGDAAASCCTGTPVAPAWLLPALALRLRPRLRLRRR